MAGAFQANAFQNNAFQTDGTTTPPGGTSFRLSEQDRRRRDPRLRTGLERGTNARTPIAPAPRGLPVPSFLPAKSQAPEASPPLIHDGGWTPEMYGQLSQDIASAHHEMDARAEDDRDIADIEAMLEFID